MCFPNDGPMLAKYRAKKRPITVWKTGKIDTKTGVVRSGFNQHFVLWRKGQIVHPHKIRKPLKHRACCSAGLYFYTDKNNVGGSSAVVKALVEPQDIIAVSFGHRLICATAAKVLDVPQPMRIKYLKERLLNARMILQSRQDDIKQWREEREDEERIGRILLEDKEEREGEEALQMIVAELKELKRRNPARTTR